MLDLDNKYLVMNFVLNIKVICFAIIITTIEPFLLNTILN